MSFEIVKRNIDHFDAPRLGEVAEEDGAAGDVEGVVVGQRGDAGAEADPPRGPEEEVFYKATNPEYLKEVKETAGLAYDPPVNSRELVGQAAREVIEQNCPGPPAEVSGPAAEGLAPMQFLAPKAITFDPAKGWAEHPHFEERFAKLWSLE